MSYGIKAKDYLERAKMLLKDNSEASLYYAAFEIRCGIEARMSEYLAVQTHISAKKKRGWQVSKLASNIEEAFRLGEQSAVIKIIDKTNPGVILDLRYTPVRKRARKIAEKLGNYLHQSKRFNEPNSNYWPNFRKLLDQGVEELEFSLSGILLGPPLTNPKTGQGDLNLEAPEHGAEDMLSLFQSMREIRMHVRYE